MTERLFDLHYVLLGEALELDGLLKAAVPVAAFRSWRRGDAGTRGPFKTSGLHIDIVEDVTRDALVVEAFAFLSKESVFLQAVLEHLTEGVSHELEVIVGVFGWGETSFHWPPELLRALAAWRLGLGVEAWPLADEQRLDARHGNNDRPTTG